MRRRTSDVFSGRRIVVTGGSSGLGFALAQALAKRGASTVLVARDPSRLDAAAEVIAASVPTARPETLSLDVADAAAVASALSDVGRLDMVFNCAGILWEGRFDSLPDDAFRQVMDINYFGAVNVVRATLAPLREARGRIVNIASAAGLTGVFGYTPYCAAKHALVGFSEALGYELRPQGVQVHTVCPGEFDSPMVTELERTRTPENRAHTLTIPKTRVATVVRDTLRGVEHDQPMIVPGRLARSALRTTRIAPSAARALGDRRIAKAMRTDGKEPRYT